MREVKVWQVFYTDYSCPEPDYLACDLIEGATEEEARANFELVHEGIEIIDIQPDGEAPESEDDLNMPCDNTGFCGGTSCPQYFTVCHKPEQYRDPFN